MIRMPRPSAAQICANDNAPVEGVATYKPFRPHTHLGQVKAAPQNALRNTLRSKTTRLQSATRRRTRFPHALFPLLALVGLAAIWYLGQETLIPAAAYGLLALALLGAAMLARHAKANRAAELGALGSLVAGAFAVVTAAVSAGLAFGIAEACLVTAAGGLGLFLLTRTRLSLLASCFALSLWGLASLPAGAEFLGVPLATPAWQPFVPALLGGLLFASQSARSTRGTVPLILLTYGWAILIAQQSTLSLPILLGLGFIAAAAHHRLGKSWADTDGFLAEFHMLIGWLFAVAAALYLQRLWMDPSLTDALLASGSHATLGWSAAFGLAAVAILISSLQRYRIAQITLPGVFLLSGVSAILPLATLRPDWVFQAFDHVPGLLAVTGFALLIAAGVSASAIAMAINGIRRMKVWQITAGVGVIGIEALLLLQMFQRTTLETGVIFLVGLITALSVSGLIAGGALDHQAPPPRPT